MAQEQFGIDSRTNRNAQVQLHLHVQLFHVNLSYPKTVRNNRHRPPRPLHRISSQPHSFGAWCYYVNAHPGPFRTHPHLRTALPPTSQSTYGPYPFPRFHILLHPRLSDDLLGRDGDFATRWNVNGESYKSVDQWSSIVVVVLVLLGCWVGHHFEVLPEERLILLKPWTKEWEDRKRRDEGERIEVVIKTKREREEMERLGKTLPNGSVSPLRARSDRPGMPEWARVHLGVDRLSLYIPRRRDTLYRPQE